MIWPVELDERRLLILRSEADRLAHACTTALHGAPLQASAARALVCSIGARIAAELGIGTVPIGTEGA
jgi:hypothetical protein